MGKTGRRTGGWAASGRAGVGGHVGVRQVHVRVSGRAGEAGGPVGRQMKVCSGLANWWVTGGSVGGRVVRKAGQLESGQAIGWDGEPASGWVSKQAGWPLGVLASGWAAW